jgi:hypothetical protein
MNRWLQFFLVQFGIDTSYLNRHVVFEHRYSVPVRGVSPTSGGSRYRGETPNEFFFLLTKSQRPSILREVIYVRRWN